ncbi:hypothetical protein F5883DRAFT_652754 [Diaporthe sp. PMI_573]|nr:hypothetical protein F5883DRAFT_652754 [Diaporthaceae sp. PMI_573]
MDMEDGLDIFRPPHPDYFAQHPHHLWDAGKLGLDLDDVFTTLPKQFNLMAIPILDRESFLLETQHVSFIAHDRTEFYTLLRSRLQVRRKEQTKMMMHTLMRLASDPRQIDLPDRGDRHWGHAMHIYRSKSYDSMVRFLAGFLYDEDPEDRIATLAADQHDHSMHQPDSAFPVNADENASTSPPPEIFARRPSSSSTIDHSERTSTVSNPRTRKRSFTPATVYASEDEDEARPTKKIRFADDMGEPRTASNPRTRKRSHTPATVNAGEDEDEAQPTKKIRDGIVIAQVNITPTQTSCQRPATINASAFYIDRTAYYDGFLPVSGIAAPYRVWAGTFDQERQRK